MKMFAISFALGAVLNSSFNSTMSAGVSKLQALQNKAAELTGKQRRLNTAWSASQQAAANYQNEMWALTQSYRSGGMSQNEYSRAVAQAKTKMQQASMSAETYREHLSRINQESARVSARISSLQAFSSAKANFSNAVKGVGTAVAAIGMAAAPIKAVVGVSMDFSTAMSKVKAITGATATDMQKLTEQAELLGRTTPYTATKSAEAMTYLGMAGWNTTQILAGMPSMLDLATASGADLAMVADILSDDLTAFGMSAEQAAHMADVFAAASTNSNTDVTMMGETFKYAGAVAGALGYSLEDVAVATGLMANAGIKGEQAGTSLRAIMTRLVSPPKAAAEAMGQLGISVTNADGTVKPFMQTMEELRDKFSGLSDSEKAEMATSIAGQEAMSGFLSVVNASEGDFEKLCSAVDNADGAASKMAATMHDNLQGDLTDAQSAIEGIAIAIGNALTPNLRIVTKGIVEAANKMAAWAQEHQGLIATLGEIAAGAATAFAAFKFIPVVTGFIGLARAGMVEFGESTAAARSVIGSFAGKLNALTWGGVMGKVASAFSAVRGVVASFAGKFVSAFGFARGALTGFIGVLRGLSTGGIIQGIVSAIQWLGVAIRGVGGAMLGIARAGIATMFSPIGIAVMGLAAAAYYCYTNWATVGPLFMGLWTTIQTAFTNAWAILQPALQGLFDAFAVLSSTVGENSGIFATLAEILGGAVVGAFITVATVAVNVLATAIGVVAATVSGIIGVFTGLIQFVTGVFTGNWTAAWNGIKNIFSSVFSTIAGIANRVLGGIQNTLSSIGNGIKRVVGMGGGGSEVAHNAQGGIYNKGAFLTTFAEDGPEAAIPLDGSKRAVSLWQRAGEILGMSKGGSGLSGGSTSSGDSSYGAPPITINLTVNGNADSASIYDAVTQAAEAARQSFADQMAAFRREERRLAYG